MVRFIIVTVCVAACSFAPSVATGPSDVHDARAADAHHVDAAIDAPPDAPPAWHVLEMLTVPCAAQTVTSQTVLATTGMYRLEASGQCVTDTGDGEASDAEYFAYNLGATTDALAGVDYGISINGPTPGPTKSPHWGAYASSHIYDVSWTGTGATITATYWDADYSDDSGSLMVAIEIYN